MTNNMLNQHDWEAAPPHLDELSEAYWASLLNEGEYAKSVIPEQHQHHPGFTAVAPLDDDDDDLPAQSVPPDTSEGYANDWHEARRRMDHDEVFALKVVGYNRGGLLVEWRSLRGFVPASQLVSAPANEGTHHRRSTLIEHVGQVLHLRVIEIDADKNRFILSERAAQVANGKRSEILHSLAPGDVTQGRVTNLCDFGAFVDLGGVEGLIHISELSWGRVGHPADMLNRGAIVDVYVLEVDPDHARIALSLKRLHPDPWATVHERYEVGQVVEGRITNVVDFGAFACIEEGLEGLIHFSELAEGHFLHPRNVVAENDLVRARILSIDGRARRLGLSLRLL